MEDKELQELFAAKRINEANRRRQEELRRMLMATTPKAAPKVRRLWPVWASAAAAILLLLLLTLPTLFRQPETKPILMAQADTLPPIPTEETIPEQADPIQTPIVRHTIQVACTEEIAMADPIEQSLIEIEIPDTPIAQNEPSITTTDTPSAPRVMRRTSSNIACEKNCAHPSYNSQDLAINLFPKDTVTRSFALKIK